MKHENPGNIVELLRNDSVSWIQSLTETEKKAIYKYSFNSGDEKQTSFIKD